MLLDVTQGSFSGTGSDIYVIAAAGCSKIWVFGVLALWDFLLFLLDCNSGFDVDILIHDVLSHVKYHQLFKSFLRCSFCIGLCCGPVCF